MIRCKSCVMPDTRPDTPFTDGECSACISYRNRPTIDWESRKESLKALLDRFDGRCIVPSSGGKDSTYQAITLKELGADVTAVTARTCHLTDIGRRNIDNLSRHVRTIEVVPNMTVRAKLNRLGLEMVGDISWPEHAAIFSTPFRVAQDMGINLIFFGENPQNQYGGPIGSEDALQMTRRWVTEFGGFLGLRPSDFVGIEGITAQDMGDYDPPSDFGGVEAHFLGAYVPWDSHRNAEVAMEHGMETLGEPPGPQSYWEWENLDNGSTGLHCHFMYLKYGYTRADAQLSVDIRSGRMTREQAMAISLTKRDFPYYYAGMSIDKLLDIIDIDRKKLREIEIQFSGDRNDEKVSS